MEIHGLTYHSTPEIISLGDPPEGRWILKPLIPAVGKTIVFGAPNDYKTFTMLDLCLAYGSNGSLFQELPLQKHGRGLFITVEGDAYDTRDRLSMLLRGQANLDPGKIDLFFGHEPIYLNTPRGIQILGEVIGDIKPGLVVLDPLRHFIPGCDENDATRVSAVCEGLNTLLRTHRFSLVVIHHAGKRGDMRGSSAWDGWADSEIQFIAARNQILEGMGGPCDVITMRQRKVRNAGYSDDFLLVPLIDDKTMTAFYSIMEGPIQGDTPVAIDGAQRILHWWNIEGSIGDCAGGFAVDSARRGANISPEKAKAGLLFLERRGRAKQIKILRRRGADGFGSFPGWVIEASTTDHIRAMLSVMKRHMAADEPQVDWAEEDTV